MAPHRCLVIVDVQRAFDPPPAYLKKLERYSRPFPCRVFTRFINPAASPFQRFLKRRACAPGTAECQLLLPVRKGDLVLDKAGKYGLSQAQIRKLKRRGIRKVVVCGLDTDACVLGVMFSLFDGGIECHLKPQMCRSSTGLHSAALDIATEQFKPLKS